MDPFTTAFLSGITTHLANRVLEASGRRTRNALSGAENKRALERCVRLGVVALVATASTDEPENAELLADIFEQFSKDPDVARELGALFRGSLPDIEELRYLFEEAGYDPETLPGLNFEEGMAAFEAGFLAAATKEPALQGIIQTNQLLAQTRLQHEMVDTMGQLVDLLRQAEQGSLAVKAGKVSVTIEGKEIEYSLRHALGTRGHSETKSFRNAYLSSLFGSTSRLSLAGIDAKAASDSEGLLNLDAVYTALLTLKPEDHERLQRDRMAELSQRRLPALAELNSHPRLVLLGDPGSGKTTFVNFVAMCLAGEHVGRHEGNLSLLTAPLPDEAGDDEEQTQPWEHGPMLPVRIILRDFAARGLPSPVSRATADHLWRFIVTELETLALGEYAPHLHRELLESGGLILLDGLDEVPEAEQRRKQIKQAVEDFAATFHRCRVLVTSRTYAYQQQAWRLPGFAEAVLAPFSRGQIHRFIDRWYAHIAKLRGLSPDDAQGRAELLKRAVFGSERLHVLAERPLLLTLMASLHAWRGGTLPEKREELYADAVNLLLDWWESPKTVLGKQGEVVVQQPSLAEWLKVDRDSVLGLLSELAYRSHKTQPDLTGTADIPGSELVDGLVSLSRNPDVKPARLIEYLSAGPAWSVKTSPSGARWRSGLSGSWLA